MLQNFPSKRQFVPAIVTTNLATCNQNSGVSSSQTHQKPTLTSENASHVTIKPENPSLSEPNPKHRHNSVILKSPDWGKHLNGRFAELFKELDSADVSIVCGRNHEILKAHRFVLSIGSEYFREALKVAPCKHPIVVVKEIPRDRMGCLLEYIYLGQVTLKNESEFKQFLKSARYLQVFGIRDEHFSVED